MQSPLLHQISSMRDSLIHDDAQNYHSLGAMAHQPRSVHGSLPLSSLASNGGGLASTILDISTTSSSHLPASTSSTSSFEQSKSDADLAHYLATSNTTSRNDQSHAHSLNREPTLMTTSLSGGGWGSGEIFDRQSHYSLSWGDSMPSIHSTPAPPIEATSSSSSASSTTTSTTDAAPEPASIRHYNARGETYLLPPIPSHSPDHTWSPRTSLDPSALTAPLSHPVSPTLHHRVNVNTGPRMPIRHTPPHDREPSPPPHLSPPPPQRYVTLAELTALPSAPVRRSASSSSSGSGAKKRVSDEMEEEEAPASKRPRLFLRDPSGSGGSAAAPSPLSRTSGSPVERGSASAADEDDEDEGDEEEEEEEEEASEDESDSSFDADDSGEFVPGRRSTRTATRRRPANQRETEAGTDKGKAAAKRVPSGEKRTSTSRRTGGGRNLGSAAEALRVVTEMANASKASAREASVSARALSPAPTMDVACSATMTLDPALEPGLVFSLAPTSNVVKIESDAPGVYGSGSDSLSSSSDSSSAPAANPYAVYSPSASAPAAMLSSNVVDEVYPPSPYAMNFTTSAGGAYPYALATSLSGSGPHYSPYSSYYTPTSSRPRRTGPALPVPVPNLIKKSRGRRVPAPDEVAAGGAPGEQRTFVCSVEGCGKCFVRGEHLKRHVRSIHTYEKPHVCPYEGCGKTFSRRDNLAQHARIHLA